MKDDRITKFFCLAADKFLADTIYETKQLSLIRLQAAKQTKKRLLMAEVMTVDDLATCLRESFCTQIKTAVIITAILYYISLYLTVFEN